MKRVINMFMHNNYYISESTTENPSKIHFELHVHDNYEIFMFLEGDSKYVIEENMYDLEPGDIIIIRKNQFHRVFHNSDTSYSRIILNIDPNFFKENGCPEYEVQFTDYENSIGNKIEAATVRASGIYDAFMRVRKYSDNFKNSDSAIVKCGIIEILHLLNNMELYSVADSKDSSVKQIIEYVNENFTAKITLSDIEKKFFISKYHLCHIFPKVTGLTFYGYLTKKRLIFAREKIKEGITASAAADAAGFSNYSSFYRAYLNVYGTSPQNDKRW